MAPTIVSYTINAGSPFASTYGNNPDVRPLDFSFAVVWDYLADPLQAGLLALGIASSVYLLSWGKGVCRVALGGVDTYRIHKMMAARVTTAR